MNKIYITNNAGISQEAKNIIKQAVNKTLEYMKITNPCEVSVLICSNDEIRELNKEYRDKDSVTDVLSFPQYDGQAVGGAIGDIVVSGKKATEQAQEYGHSFEREIAFLTVHSMLHLLGMDHETSKQDEQEMFGLQDEILSYMGCEKV